MTTTLLLRMAGPTQGWDSRRRRADYGRVATVSSLEWWGPTASGVAGLLAAALGRPRTHDCGDLLACEYIVRTDRPGRPRAEFRSRHERGEDGAIARPRHFVETVIDDAAYLVAVRGENDLMAECAVAVQAPFYPLFYGKREFPITPPLLVRVIHEGSALDALLAEPPISPGRASDDGHRTLTLTRVTPIPRGTPNAHVHLGAVTVQRN